VKFIRSLACVVQRLLHGRFTRLEVDVKSAIAAAPGISAKFRVETPQELVLIRIGPRQEVVFRMRSLEDTVRGSPSFYLFHPCRPVSSGLGSFYAIAEGDGYLAISAPASVQNFERHNHAALRQ